MAVEITKLTPHFMAESVEGGLATQEISSSPPFHLPSPLIEVQRYGTSNAVMQSKYGTE